ncbi:MAG: hypothetical protein M0P31_14700 [Solirubrobacteraceae bacterium]|nr:hypothetical protein [Solirubrobacteraceae bacterium]
MRASAPPSGPSPPAATPAARRPPSTHRRRGAVLPLLLLVLATVLGASPARAGAAATRAAIEAHVDRTLRAWEPRIAADGEVREPFLYDAGAVERYPAYGTPMLGYAYLRAGIRTGRAAWIEKGLRSVTYAARNATPSPFDAWAVVTALGWAEEHLRGDARYEAARGTWLAYLRGWRGGSSDVEQCYTKPTCFNNWKLVDALASARILALGASSDPAELARHVRAYVDGMAVRHAGPRVRDTSTRARVISDPPSNPLAYHVLSAGILQQIDAAGPFLSTDARSLRADAVRFVQLATAPDGDVSYMGRSSQQSWTLAASMLVGVVAMPTDRGGAGRWQRLVDRAWAKLVAYPTVDDGMIAITPSVTSLTYDSLDAYAGMAVYNGLTLFLLQEAIDRLPARRVRPAALPSERGRGFTDLRGSAVSVLAGPGVWVAVQGRRTRLDPRVATGILQAKVRRGGRWVDLTPGRPFGAGIDPVWGPQLRWRGMRLPMVLKSARIRRGVLVARGGFVWGGRIVRGTTFRFRARDGRVTMRFRARKGDRFTWTAYLDEGWTSDRGFHGKRSRIRFDRTGRATGRIRATPTALSAYAERHEWSVTMRRDGALTMTLSR